MVKDELHQNNNIIWLHYQLFQCKPDPARKKSHKNLVLKTAGEFDWSEGGMVILAAATEHTHSYCAANSQINSALKHARYHRNWNSWNVNFANPIQFIHLFCLELSVSFPTSFNQGIVNYFDSPTQIEAISGGFHLQNHI